MYLYVILIMYHLVYTSTFLAVIENDFDIQKRNADTFAAKEQKSPKTFVSKIKINKQPKKFTQNISQEKNLFTPFELSIKSAFESRKKNSNLSREKSLQEAKQLWEKSKKSPMLAKDFLQPLVDRWNDGKLHELYSGTKLDDSQEEIENDLKTISPFAYKTWRDSFVQKRNMLNQESREDDPYFAWLDKHPEYITRTINFHESTPIEIAVKNQSKQMLNNLIHIASKHNISIKTLIEPLFEQYKTLYFTKGNTAAFNYLDSIYTLNNNDISKALYEEIKDADFENYTKK